MITQPSAKIILDSISPSGHRLTTMECTFHRYVLAEFNTHRAFSRNSASSRAIPVEKLINRVLTDPAIPLEWGSNKPGMQAGEVVDENSQVYCYQQWQDARDAAVRVVQNLNQVHLHKQIVNRLLEPFLWQTAIVSSTEWDNFFEQRASPICTNCGGKGFDTLYYQLSDPSTHKCSGCKGTGCGPSLASPEMTAIADAMRNALKGSKPVKRLWHMPYVDEDYDPSEIEMVKQISIGRCANGGTFGFDGEPLSPSQSIRIFDKLKNATPPHMSPFEHVAMAEEPQMVHWQKMGVGNYGGGTMEIPTHGNFRGWKQYRHEVFGR